MVVSTLIYDATTGTDTAASGAGPAAAVTGSSATNGAGNIVNLDGAPDLSGVAVNDVLWVNSATTNRHLSRITAVDNGAKTVTTEDLLVLGGGVSWAIGGFRKTLDSDTGNPDVQDAKPGWTYSLEKGNYAIATASLPIVIPVKGTVPLGSVVVEAAAGADPTITWTGNNHLWEVGDFGCDFDIIGLDIRNTVSVSASAKAFSNSSANFSTIRIVRCYLQCYGVVYDGDNGSFTARATEFVSTNGSAIVVNGKANYNIRNCTIRAGAGASDIGIHINSSVTFWSTVIAGNIIRECGGDGIRMNSAGRACSTDVVNNVIHENGGNGICFDNSTNADYGMITMENNLITNNGGYGIESSTDQTAMLSLFSDYNAFFSNTSGEVQRVLKGSHSLTLTADPYLDEANDDYTLNVTGGGGAACRNTGFGYPG